MFAALGAACVGSEPPSLSSTTVAPPESLAVDPCPLTVPEEHVNLEVPAGGGSHTLDVITGASCSWTLESRSPFISITSQSSGQGSTSVTVTVQPNTGAARSGSVVVNQLTVTILQGAAPCEFDLSSTGQSFDADGGTGTVGVSVKQGVDCQWTAASNASFITVTSGSSGTGGGSVAFRVAENRTTAARSGSLSIADMSFSVNQAAPVPEPPPVVGLSVSGYQQPWCGTSLFIRANPGPNFPVVNAPGPFSFPARAIVIGTTVVLTDSGTGGSVVEWSSCDNESSGSCQVTMNSNRDVSASIAQSCASPSFSGVSRVDVSGTWTVTFTAVNLVPFAGTTFGGVTFTASCMGFSTSINVASPGSGTFSGSMTVPVSSCPTGGTLSLSDFNGSASTSW